MEETAELPARTRQAEMPQHQHKMKTELDYIDVSYSSNRQHCRVQMKLFPIHQSQATITLEKVEDITIGVPLGVKRNSPTTKTKKGKGAREEEGKNSEAAVQLEQGQCEK
ncbi:hypothetical protein EK904_014878 [Melospiza melodia maxima]|nr:hypothetical protein EK904_014878 [Melospiza melodia maxima]